MSGSSIDRSRTEWRADTCGDHRRRRRGARRRRRVAGGVRPTRSRGASCSGTSVRSGVGSARSTTRTRCAPTVAARPGRRAVEGEPTVVDDEHAVAEPLDVAHVVGREQQRGAPLAPLGDAGTPAGAASRARRGRSSARRGRAAGVVQQGCRDLAAHALAERQLAHRRAERRARSRALDEAVGAAARQRARRAVDGGEEPKESRSGRSHQSCERWPKTTPIAPGHRDALAARDRARRCARCPTSARGCRSAS